METKSLKHKIPFLFYLVIILLSPTLTPLFDSLISLLISRIPEFPTQNVDISARSIRNPSEAEAGYMGDDSLGKALPGADLVIIPVRHDLFNINTGIAKSLCPHVFNKAGTYDEKKLFGVTTLDVVRAKTFFYAGKANVPVAEVNVPVVGGHAGITILPLFSQASPQANLSDDLIKALTKRIQDGGTQVVEAKAGKGSATLSMAYAGALFADACLKGLNGVQDVVECSFVQSTITDLPFFASKVRLGKNGVEELLDLGPLSDFEKEGLEALKAELRSSIEKGVKFANQ